MDTSNPSSLTAASTLLLAESFTGVAFTSNRWVVGTSRFNRNRPILTAAAGTDSPGNGALRLTSGAAQQAGFALYNSALATSRGLSVTFDFASYGGTGADGLSFFLVDGTADPSLSGAPGGSLGYATSRYSDHPGLAGAYMGVGFDEFGGFSDPENSAIGGPGSRPDSISLRGSAQNAYRYLTSSNSLPGGIDSATRTYRRAQINLSGGGILNVSIDLNGDLDFNDTGEAAIKDFNLVAVNKALPGTVKIGFAAAAGDKTNIHEIRNLSVGDTPPPTGSFDLGSLAATLTYTENQPELTVAGTSTISPGGKQLDQVGVRILGNYLAGQDILTIAGQTGTQGTVNGLSWEFRATTGLLVIRGNGTADAYQAALRQVTYFNNSNNPDVKPRTIELSLVAKDGTRLAKNATLNVLAVNDAPTLRLIAQEGVQSGILGATVGPVFVTDPDNTYNLTVSDSRFEIVSTGPNTGLLKLRVGQGLTRPADITITGTDNSTSPAITFSQRLTIGVYTIPNPAGAITIGGLSSNAPIVYNTISTPLLIARGLTLSGGGGNGDGAIVKIIGTGFNGGKERLGLAGSTVNSGTINGINWVYDPATGTLTFRGPATLAAYQNALSQVTYSSGAGATGDRAIQFIVGNGANAGAGNLVVTFGKNNGTPDSTLGGPTAISLTNRIVAAGTAAGTVVGTITVTDPDSTTFNYVLSDPRFEVVNGQMKLKAGQTIAAPLDLSITAYDGVIGATGTQSFTQVFNLVPLLPEIFLRDYNTSAASALFYINNASQLAGVRYLSNDGRQDAANRFNLPTKWRAEALGDINRDGFNDVVYRNTTNGEESVYIAFLGEGGRIIGQDYVKFQNQLSKTEDNANWQIRGLSDMDGNGTLELVLHNAQLDRTAIWYLPSDGSTNLTDVKFVTRGSAIAGLQSPGTNLVGVGDFDGDGKSELLFRNNLTDRTTLWKLNGAAVVQAQLLIPTGQSSWEIKLVADFNNDGRADIAWQNTSNGQSAIWLSTAGPTGTITAPATAANSFLLPAPGANWSFEAAADFNHDGTNDIVLRNKVDDTLRIWTIRGGQFGTDNLIQNGSRTFVLGNREWDVEGAGQFGATPA
jgi:hypothetical protein